MARLDLLPPELLHDITAKLVDTQNLKALRFACRSSKAAVEPILFRAVTFSRQLSHQQSFESIYGHSQFRYHVRELRYSVTRAQRHEGVDSAESFQSILQISDLQLPPKESEQFYKDYDAARQYSETLTRAELAAQLGKGLRLLPNIRAITVVEDTRQTGWFKSFPFLLSVLIPPWNGSSFERVRPFNSRFLDSTATLEDLETIADAVIASSAQIRLLDLSTLNDWDVGSIKDSRIDRGPPIPLGSINLVAGLTSLSLVLESMIDIVLPLPYFWIHCHLLKHLDLDYLGRHLEERQTLISMHFDQLDWTFVPEDASFEMAFLPSLETLTLSTMAARGSTLSRILDLHPHLKRLYLRGLYYSDEEESITIEEAWEGALESIRSLHLDSIILENVTGFIRNVSDTRIVVDEDAVSNYKSRHRHYPNGTDCTPLLDDSRLVEASSKISLQGEGKPLPKESRLEAFQSMYSSVRTVMNPGVREVRERITNDAAYLHLQIMDYAYGRSHMNPLVGLVVHPLIDWSENSILRSDIIELFKDMK